MEASKQKQFALLTTMMRIEDEDDHSVEIDASLLEDTMGCNLNVSVDIIKCSWDFIKDECLLLNSVYLV